MADENQDYSRLNNKNKRRKPRKWLSLVLAIAGVALVVVLLIAVLNDKPTMDEQANGEQNNKTIAEQIQGNKDTGSSGEEDTDTEQKDDEKQDDEKEKEGKQEAEPSDDNVKEAYTKDWEPVGTEQTGGHTTTFQQGTQDWNEILQAAGGAVGLDPATLTAWYIGNNGNGGNDVIATISGPDSAETFRVYASWVDGEGWQATKVEVLKENDRQN